MIPSPYGVAGKIMSGEKSIDDMLKENCDGYRAARAKLEAEHMGRTALLHQGEVVDICDDDGDAYKIGCGKYGLGNFTIQVIGERPFRWASMLWARP